jgi:hypothetical protein
MVQVVVVRGHKKRNGNIVPQSHLEDAIKKVLKNGPKIECRLILQSGLGRWITLLRFLLSCPRHMEVEKVSKTFG